jgi:SAM-dependent methyltransferase
MWLDLIDLARGHAPAREPVLRALTERPANTVLLDTALTQAGRDRDRAILDRHRTHFGWSSAVSLSHQEYPLLLPQPRFEESLPGALSTAEYGSRVVRSLQRAGRRAPAVARDLVVDLHTLAEQAAMFAQQWQTIRPMLGPTLHVLQAQALLRLDLVAPSIRGWDVLEVGPQTGTFMRALEARGARVSGVDVELRAGVANVVQGDFMTAPLGRFDLVVATAVFEFGSGWNHFRGADGKVPVLARLREVLKPGGHVLMENLAYPLPFSAAQAEDAGFRVCDVRVVRSGVCWGGRGAVLQALPGA